jgi:nucleoside-diphosphate-sugar epimerase
LHSIPVLESGDPTPTLLALLGKRIERIVYLSTTNVYGATVNVDEHTPAAPATESARLRLAAEHAVQAGPWSSLVLRPAAIYGPDRGVHVKMQRGEFRLPGDGSGYVSRIHVDDLATFVTAALDANVTGVYPIADDEPCTSVEIARFCANLLHVEMPVPGLASRRTNRRVDGSAIRRALGVELRYPTYREGIRAAVEG